MGVAKPWQCDKLRVRCQRYTIFSHNRACFTGVHLIHCICAVIIGPIGNCAHANERYDMKMAPNSVATLQTKLQQNSHKLVKSTMNVDI